MKRSGQNKWESCQKHYDTISVLQLVLNIYIYVSATVDCTLIYIQKKRKSSNLEWLVSFVIDLFTSLT